MILSYHRGNDNQGNIYSKIQKPTSFNNIKLDVGLNPDSFKPLFLYIWSPVVLLFHF